MQTQMPGSSLPLTLVLICAIAADAYGLASARDRLFQAAYCLGAIRESHHNAVTHCEERWDSMEFSSVSECEDLSQVQAEALSEKHQRYTNFISRQLSRMNSSSAKEVETLIKLGEDHVASNQIDRLKFYDLCMRDCMNWPPNEGCIFPAR